MNPLLKLHLGHDEYRPWMSKPFDHNGYTYATDAYTIIRVPMFDEVYHNEVEQKTIDKIIEYTTFEPNCEILIDVEAIRTILQTIEEVPDEVDCEDCDGDGHFYHGSYPYDCKNCEGNGFYEDKENLILPQKFVKIGEQYLSLANVERVIISADILDKLLYLVKHDVYNKAAIFKTGEAIIFAMPYSPSLIVDEDVIYTINI